MNASSRPAGDVIGSPWIPVAFAVLLGGVVFLLFNRLADLPLKWMLALFGVASILLVGALSRRLRDLVVLGLVLSAPLALNVHLIFREEHVGVSDGLAIESLDLLLAAAAAFMLWDLFSHRTIRFNWYPAFTLPAVVLILAGVLSFSQSVDLELSLYGLVEQLRTLAFFLILANCLNSRRDFKLLHTGLLLAVAVIGAICIVEAIRQTNFVATPDAAGEDELFRSAGLVTSTLTGGYLASLLPILTAQFWIFRKPAGRFLVVLSFLIGAAGLITTLSRGAWAVFAIGMLVLFFSLGKLVKIKARHVMVVALVVVSVAALAHKSIERRLDEGMDNVVARIGLLETAGNMVAASPVVGVGLNTYVERMDEFSPERAIHDFNYLVHNKYMLVWAETGTLGLLAFLWLAGVALRRSRALIRFDDPLISITAAGLFAALLAVLADMGIESYEAGLPLRNFWILVAAVAGLSAVARSAAPRRPVARDT